MNKRTKFEKIKDIISFEADNNMPCHSRYNYDEEIDQETYKRIIQNILKDIRRIELKNN